MRVSLGAARRRWGAVVEPWYLSFVLLTITTSGLQPILLPLAVREHGDLTHAGMVVAAANLGAVAHVAGFTAVTALGMGLVGLGALCALPLVAAVPRELPAPLSAQCRSPG